MIGRVYKIIVNCSNDIYIGSTLQECRARWQEHKDLYNTYKRNKARKVVVYDLFEKYGVENCKTILIKEYEVVDKNHLHAYETLWINKLKPINKQSPFRINYIYRKNIYHQNIEKNRDYSRKYYQNQVDKNQNFNQERYQKLIHDNPNYYKELYQKRLEKDPNFYKKKIICECGLEIVKNGIYRHKKTKIHQTRLTKS